MYKNNAEGKVNKQQAPFSGTVMFSQELHVVSCITVVKVSALYSST